MILGLVLRWYAVVDAQGALIRPLDGNSDDVIKHPEGGLQLKTGERVEARYVTEREAEWRDGKPVHAEHGVPLSPTTEKMSKARGNVVNPDDVADEHGADSLRLYEMFMGPLEQAKPWQTSGIQGVRRFLDRIHAIGMRPLASGPMDDATARLVHRTVRKVGEDIDGLRLNTAVSAMMILVNHLTGLAEPPREAVEKLVLILAPLAPHLAEELWVQLGHTPSIADAAWPAYDPALCEDAEIELPVQVNGKVRGHIRIARDAEQDRVQAAALADPSVQKYIAGKPLRKLIYVPGRIVTIVV
jgi:leucyl-tRNA synthetase